VIDFPKESACADVLLGMQPNIFQISQARKQENAARRAAAQANVELCTYLLEQARQRGQAAIDWPEYFRNAYMVD
jgi:hypothetical protein